MMQQAPSFGTALEARAHYKMPPCALRQEFVGALTQGQSRDTNREVHASLALN